jgi:hypothetical protein
VPEKKGQELSNLENYQLYAALADQMLHGATHDELVEALKILALNLTAYKTKHGEIPQTEVLATLRSGEIGDDMALRLTDTMAQLIGVMRTVMANPDRQVLNLSSRTHCRAVYCPDNRVSTSPLSICSDPLLKSQTSAASKSPMSWLMA